MVSDISIGMKRIVIFLLLVLMGGCARRNPVADMSFQTTPAPPYVIANWYKMERPGEPLKIYIEGDGNAFDSQGQATDNPTPQGLFMRELVAGDPSPNVVYLARPCQYLKPACTQKDWTSGRFSKAIIDSMDQTVLSLMKKARTDQVILIGFSGGAQVAGLVAVRHPKQVKHLITISGVLDHKAWTTYHGDAPLTDSLNLADYKQVLKGIPQTHYAGEKDPVVPVRLTQDFVGDKVIVVPKATHGDGYESIVSKIYEVS